MDITILEDLGLTNAEIKVYLALLELGTSTAGPLLERSGLQNSVVHRALHSLIDKGLINFIMEGKRRTYQATNPENFYHFIDEKKERFSQILPELKQKQQEIQQQKDATVYKGLRGVNEVYRIMRESGKEDTRNSNKKTTEPVEYLSFGGGEICLHRMGEAWWSNHHTKRVALKLPSRQVFDATVKHFGTGLEGRPISQVRYVSHEFSQMQETVIVGNRVAITVFAEQPYSLLIDDARVAEGYKKHFEIMWQQAKKE